MPATTGAAHPIPGTLPLLTTSGWVSLAVLLGILALLALTWRLAGWWITAREQRPWSRHDAAHVKATGVPEHLAELGEDPRTGTLHHRDRRDSAEPDNDADNPDPPTPEPNTPTQPATGGVEDPAPQTGDDTPPATRKRSGHHQPADLENGTGRRSRKNSAGRRSHRHRPASPAADNTDRVGGYADADTPLLEIPDLPPGSNTRATLPHRPVTPRDSVWVAKVLDAVDDGDHAFLTAEAATRPAQAWTLHTLAASLPNNPNYTLNIHTAWQLQNSPTAAARPSSSTVRPGADAPGRPGIQRGRRLLDVTAEEPPELTRLRVSRRLPLPLPDHHACAYTTSDRAGVTYAQAILDRATGLTPTRPRPETLDDTAATTTPSAESMLEMLHALNPTGISAYLLGPDPHLPALLDVFDVLHAHAWLLEHEEHSDAVALLAGRTLTLAELADELLAALPHVDGHPDLFLDRDALADELAHAPLRDTDTR